ncbi:hypothetical protein [Lentzea sp.]|uniref:hypothetical protein n=1 Tax=Lentzea sp. TaxID=56099 RepID=UPI002C1F8B31|nr:hypothetical protein [Lentzea sp.]HUQ56117.1 hypothetical protein [Lentzea sp.]
MRVTWREKNARQWISELSDRIGMAGWTALAVTPALAAEVGQHRGGAGHPAARRRGCRHGGGGAARLLCAGSARPLPDWSPTSWLGVQLMAVCQLVHAHDVKPLAFDALPEVN